VQRKKQRRQQMTVVNVGVVLGEERITNAKLIGEANEVGDFIEDFGAGLGGGAFEVVGEGDLEHGGGASY